MIRTFDICINAAHPEVKLYEAATFISSPSTAFVRGVPPAMGSWRITAVRLAAAWPDGSIENTTATQTGDGVWAATLQGMDASGRVENGLQVLADGVDETGAAVTGYVLGIADLAVYTRDATIDVDGQSWYVKLFDSAPTPPHKGDAYISSGYLLIFDGTQWITIGGGGGGGIVDDNVTRTSSNAVKSSGIWSAIWGALTALPTGFTALYDWVVDQLTGKADKSEMSVTTANDTATITLKQGTSATVITQHQPLPAAVAPSTSAARGAYADAHDTGTALATRAAASDLTALAQTVAGKLSTTGDTRTVTATDSGGTETYIIAGTGETTGANVIGRIKDLPYVNVGEAAEMLVGVYGILSRGVQRHTATSGETSATFGFADTPGTGKIADALLDIDNSANASALGLEFNGLGTAYALAVNAADVSSSKTAGEVLAEMTTVEANTRARFYFTETSQTVTVGSTTLPVISIQRLSIAIATVRGGAA